MAIAQTISGWVASARKSAVRSVLRPHDAAVAGTLLQAVEKSGLNVDLQAALMIAESPVTRLQDIPLRIAHARRIADLCAAANMRQAAPGYVSRNTNIEHARVALVNAKADEAPQINSTIPPFGGRGGHHGSADEKANEVYKRRAESIAAAKSVSKSTEE